MNKQKKHSKLKILSIIGILLAIIMIAVSASYNDSESSQSSSSSKKIDTENKAKINKLNNWFENTKKQEINNDYTEHSNNPDTVKTWKMSSVVKGYKVQNNELLVLISKNRMESENLSDDAVAKWALYGILFEYPNFDKDITSYKNIGTSTNPTDAKNAKSYIEYVQ